MLYFLHQGKYLYCSCRVNIILFRTTVFRPPKKAKNTIKFYIDIIFNSRGSKKRPISLDSDEEEESPSNKSIKTEDPNKPQCIDLLDSPPNSPSILNQKPKEEPPDSPKDTKTNRFILGMERLLNASPVDEAETCDNKNINGPDCTTLTALLGKRSQALRNLRNKIYELSQILFPDVDLPDIEGASLDDSSIEDFLDTVIAAHQNTTSCSSDNYENEGEDS